MSAIKELADWVSFLRRQESRIKALTFSSVIRDQRKQDISAQYEVAKGGNKDLKEKDVS
jgi:hypothetical protein